MYRRTATFLSFLCLFVCTTPVIAQDAAGFPEVASQDVSIDGGTFTLPATLELPEASEPVPCVVFMAGSGPTDRNWNSAMVPGGIGSARLLAEALRSEGIGSVRFDKTGSGANATQVQGLTVQQFADEGVAAYRYLSSNPACGRIFVVGNSEGGIHSLSVGSQLQGEADFGGVVTLSGAGRSLANTMIEQLDTASRLEGHSAEQIQAGLAVLRTALEGLPDTATNPPDFSVFPDYGIFFQSLIASTGGELDLLIGLMFTDPVALAGAYSGPALIVSASHDAQIPVSDGDLVFAALPDSGQIRRRVTIENASHVYREETRTIEDVENPTILMLAYWEEGRPLAPGAVEAIVSFIRDVSQ